MDLHNRLIAAFLEPQATLPQIAADAGLTLGQLAQWFNHPGTQAALEELREMARFRSQLLADLGLPAAVQHLDHITAQLAALEPGPDAPIATHLRLADTVRRNATAIQRLATPRPLRAAAPDLRITDVPRSNTPADQDLRDILNLNIPAEAHADPLTPEPFDAAPAPTTRARDDPHTAAA
jgi:hypothetical protein